MADVKQMVPAFLLDDNNGYAMAKMIEYAMEYLRKACTRGLEIVFDIDKMPEWRLDELAWEYDVTWYDADADIDSKRAQIKAAQAFFDKMGTPKAVEEALAAVYGAGRLEEWWEYGGEPYHFSVYVTDASALTEKRARFMKLLSMVQNVRSVLDNVYYSGASGSANVYSGTKVGAIDGVIRAVAQ
jgi:phage tail P2-like protein